MALLIVVSSHHSKPPHVPSGSSGRQIYSDGGRNAKTKDSNKQWRKHMEEAEFRLPIGWSSKATTLFFFGDLQDGATGFDKELWKDFCAIRSIPSVVHTISVPGFRSGYVHGRPTFISQRAMKPSTLGWAEVRFYLRQDVYRDQWKPNGNRRATTTVAIDPRIVSRPARHDIRQEE